MFCEQFTRNIDPNIYHNSPTQNHLPKILLPLATILPQLPLQAPTFSDHFHSRKISTKITNVHERCLQLIHSDKRLFSEELLEKDRSVSIHHENILILTTEMYKAKNNLSLKIFSDFFVK